MSVISLDAVRHARDPFAAVALVLRRARELFAPKQDPQALRAAAVEATSVLVGRPDRAISTAAALSVFVTVDPKSETPAVAAAGVSEVPTRDRSEAMPTVPQPQPTTSPVPSLPALTCALDRTTSAQARAIVTWHQREALVVIDEALSLTPSWPLIPCAERPRTFAPRRGSPSPAGAA